MAFENDPEAHAIAVRYAGRDFDKRRTISYTVLDLSGDGLWTVEQFQKLISLGVSRIPPNYVGTARVTLVSGDEYSRDRLFISYEGPEEPDVVSARIESCRLQIERERTTDFATYQRLKKKFEGDVF